MPMRWQIRLDTGTRHCWIFGMVKGLSCDQVERTLTPDVLLLVPAMEHKKHARYTRDGSRSQQPRVQCYTGFFRPLNTLECWSCFSTRQGIVTIIRCMYRFNSSFENERSSVEKLFKYWSIPTDPFCPQLCVLKSISHDCVDLSPMCICWLLSAAITRLRPQLNRVRHALCYTGHHFPRYLVEGLE